MEHVLQPNIECGRPFTIPGGILGIATAVPGGVRRPADARESRRGSIDGTLGLRAPIGGLDRSRAAVAL
jgi:hypothetical protein